jgi:hypothetical protein
MSSLHPEIRRIQMTKLRLLSAAVILAASAAAPGLALARDHVRYYLPYDISFNHNYGPGLLPGTFAYYDGPSTNACWQSSATYLGQDHRRHPCN